MTDASLSTGWQRRFTMIGLCFCATFVCYIDRVNISVAIIPMSKELGWDPEVQGIVLSSCSVWFSTQSLPAARSSLTKLEKRADP